MKKKLLDVVFVLDKSGSMHGSEESTIHSFNEYLERERNGSFQTKITTILFSDHYEYLHNREAIQNVQDLTHDDYIVGGCTALYDALGAAISKMEATSSDKVLFVIITDGEENASKEYRKETIKKLIKKHSNWEFVYIGADIDSYANGGALGIDRSHIANYRKDKKGTSLLFQSLGKVEAAMMGEVAVSSQWKEDLDQYYSDTEA